LGDCIELAIIANIKLVLTVPATNLLYF